MSESVFGLPGLQLELLEEACAGAEHELATAAIAFSACFEDTSAADYAATHYDFVDPFPEYESLMAAARTYFLAWAAVDAAQIM